MSLCQNPSCEKELSGYQMKFCSRSCAAIVNNSLRPKRKRQSPGPKNLTLVCQNSSCRKALTGRQKKFCSNACSAFVTWGQRRRTHEEKNAAKAAYILKRYHRRRAAAIEQLGGRCVQCGSVENLDFDHIDRSQKTFAMSKAFSTWSEIRVQAELAKCQLLCKDCHKGKHQDDRYGKPECRHGTLTMYQKRRCRCDDCKRAQREYSQARRRRQKSAPIGQR